MEFGTSNNKSDKKPSVNTRGVQLYNQESINPSTIALGFWNDYLSIRINPAFPKDKRTETKVYDYETYISATLVAEDGFILADAIKNEILPAIVRNTMATEKESVTKSIVFGRNKMILVSTGTKSNDFKPYVAIMTGLNEKRIPEDVLIYEFKSSNLINDYDAGTGEFESSSDFPSGMVTFMNFLKEGAKALLHAEAHSTRFVDNYFRGQLLGDKPASSGYKGNGFNAKDAFTSPAQDTSSMTDGASVENVDSMSAFMDGDVPF